MAYSSDDSELGFLPIPLPSLDDVGKIGGIIGKIGGIFGGSPEEKNCLDLCTGQVIGRFKKKDGGCHELTPYGERGISESAYQGRVKTSSGEPFQQAYNRICGAAARRQQAARQRGRRRGGGIGPMMLLLIGGGAYFYFSRR